MSVVSPPGILKDFRRKALEDIAPEDVVRACEQNYIDYWACAAAHPWAEFSEVGGVTRALTGLPNEIFNVVLRCSLRVEDVERAIDGAIEDFKRRRIPLIWHVGLLTEPKDLGRYLEERGFPRDYELRAMAIDLGSPEVSHDSPKGMCVEVVTEEPQSRKWIGCLSSSWHLPSRVPDWMVRNPCFNVALPPKGGISPPRRMYLGHADDEPVSACMLFWSEDIAGLQAVGTVPHAQNRGAGSAVVMAALRDARAMGHRTAVVLSTIEGVNLYEKLGFRIFGSLPEHSMRFD